jgi:hypothetical protein
MEGHQTKGNVMSNATLLTRTLTANAVFSALSGVVLAVFSVPLADWLGIPTWIAIAVGVGLVGFAASVYSIARNPKPALVKQVIASDIGWVVGAAVLIIGFPDAMSTEGLWTLGLVSLVVADFAVLQWLGLRRVTESASSTAVTA